MQKFSNPKQQQIEFDEHQLQVELEKAVAPFHFTEEMKRNVLHKAKPSIWEREVTIPIPAAAIVILLMIGLGIYSFPQSESNPDKEAIAVDQLVNISTGLFWESDLKGGSKK